MDATLIVTGVITLLMGIVIACIPTIKMKLTASQWELLCKLAYIGVMAVQQIYRDCTGDDIGEKKYQEVKEWLQMHNLKASSEDIEKAIEAAVIRMKQELASGQKQI